MQILITFLSAEKGLLSFRGSPGEGGMQVKLVALARFQELARSECAVD